MIIRFPATAIAPFLMIFSSPCAFPPLGPSFFESWRVTSWEAFFIINVVLLKESERIQHLSLSNVEKIIQAKKPKLTVLTHFGMTVLRAKPWELAEKISKNLDLKVVAASDGLEIDLNSIK